MPHCKRLPAFEKPCALPVRGATSARGTLEAQESEVVFELEIYEDGALVQDEQPRSHILMDHSASTGDQRGELPSSLGCDPRLRSKPIRTNPAASDQPTPFSRVQLNDDSHHHL